MDAKLRIAVVQMDIAFGAPRTNRDKVAQWIEQAMPHHPDVVVFPELWDTAYDLERLEQLADWEGEETKAFLSAVARDAGVAIVAGSIAEKRSDGIYNTSFVFSKKGDVIATYRKAHLFRPMEEHRHFQAGDACAVYRIDDVSCATVICYDVRFPEWVRTAALAGAQVLFVPAQWPHPRLNHWRQLLIARAIENQLYVVGCNRVGTAKGTSFCGHSMVVDPWGEIVCEALQREEILIADVHLDRVAKTRHAIPVFSDRRPDLYAR